MNIPSSVGWVSTTAIGWGVCVGQEVFMFWARESLVYLHLGLLAGGAVIELGTVFFQVWKMFQEFEQIDSKTYLFTSYVKINSKHTSQKEMANKT